MAVRPGTVPTPTKPAGVPTMLEQEARALLTRLARVKPFALQETMVPAAALSPAAHAAIEQHLLGGRREVRDQVMGYVRWLRDEGRTASPEEMQRRFTVLRLRFNNALSQFDLFSEVVTQRSEQETGVWLAGLDVAATDAIALPATYFQAPPLICYLARGFGGAIRRARTRLPGGGRNPVGIIRIPRERMIGHGIASSLVHEVGHQAAALLGLVPSLRVPLQARQLKGTQREKLAWGFFERWVSEIVADFWAIGKIGISSTLGLISVVTLPRWFVFRLSPDDPHPFPWIRVKLSCAIGNELYPHQQWAALARTWEALYPPAGLDSQRRELVTALEAALPEFVTLLVSHRPAALKGKSLREVMPLAERSPEQLLRLHRRWRARTAAMLSAPPSLVFAVLGQGRASGELAPEQESEALGRMMTFWALRSTLDAAEACAARPAGRLAAPLRPLSTPLVPV